MEALLVVDVDHGDGWKSNINGHDTEMKRVALAIRDHVSAWRREQKPIAFIVMGYGNVSRSGNVAQIRGMEPASLIKFQSQMSKTGSAVSRCIVCDLPMEYRLASFLEHRHGEQFEPAFIKNQCNAFTNPELAKYLRAQQVDLVELVGCSTFACILDTAVGAISQGFDVRLVRQCTYPTFAAYSRHANAEECERDWFSRVRASLGMPLQKNFMKIV